VRVALHIGTPNLEPLEPILDALEGRPIQAWIAQSAFISLGPSVVHHLRLAGFDAYLDLRLSGEAESVARSVEAVRRQGALGVTVDLGSGPKAARAAVQASKGRLEVIGVAGPLDCDVTRAETLQIAHDCRMTAVLVNASDAGKVPQGTRMYVRTETLPVDLRAEMLVVSDRILCAADPAAACDQLFAELA
jgi:hypothetical protein